MKAALKTSSRFPWCGSRSWPPGSTRTRNRRSFSYSASRSNRRRESPGWSASRCRSGTTRSGPGLCPNPSTFAPLQCSCTGFRRLHPRSGLHESRRSPVAPLGAGDAAQGVEERVVLLGPAVFFHGSDVGQDCIIGGTAHRLFHIGGGRQVFRMGGEWHNLAGIRKMT